MSHLIMIYTVCLLILLFVLNLKFCRVFKICLTPLSNTMYSYNLEWKSIPQKIRDERVQPFNRYNRPSNLQNPLKTRNPLTGSLANSEDLDDMQHFISVCTVY